MLCHVPFIYMTLFNWIASNSIVSIIFELLQDLCVSNIKNWCNHILLCIYLKEIIDEICCIFVLSFDIPNKSRVSTWSKFKMAANIQRKHRFLKKYKNYYIFPHSLANNSPEWHQTHLLTKLFAHFWLKMHTCFLCILAAILAAILDLDHVGTLEF